MCSELERQCLHLLLSCLLYGACQMAWNRCNRDATISTFLDGIAGCLKISRWEACCLFQVNTVWMKKRGNSSRHVTERLVKRRCLGKWTEICDLCRVFLATTSNLITSDLDIFNHFFLLLLIGQLNKISVYSRLRGISFGILNFLKYF